MRLCAARWSTGLAHGTCPTWVPRQRSCELNSSFVPLWRPVAYSGLPCIDLVIISVTCENSCSFSERRAVCSSFSEPIQSDGYRAVVYVEQVGRVASVAAEKLRRVASTHGA